MNPANGSSGMGYERKKRGNGNGIDNTIASSSSAHFYRGGQRSSNRSGFNHPPRSESPPASAYFPLLSANGEGRNALRPTPNAEQHFAYSTQFRRHQTDAAAALASPAVFAATVNAEATSLWRRAINWVTGQQPHEYQAVEDGEESAAPKMEDRRDTPSSHYAHVSPQVRHSISLLVDGL
jgi:Ca2+-transporting ATPase